jgi:hypothetical protein
MNKEKFILQEEINRMKKLATYDKSKTLNEQTAGEMEASGARYNNNVANNVKNIGLVKAKSPKFPCVYYKKDNLNTEGRYTPANMDFVRLFNPNSIVVYWENNTIKEYVRSGNASGAETKKGTWKCKSDNSGVDVVWANNTPEQPKTQQAKKPPLKVAGQSTPNTTESSIGVIYQYEYPKDTKYRYGVKDKKWFGKNLANGREFDLSTITTTITNLNRQFPNAMTQVEEPPLPVEKPAAPNPETATPGVVQAPTK